MNDKPAPGNAPTPVPADHPGTAVRVLAPPRPPIERWEWTILAVLIVGGLWSWSRYYLSFEMPNPDFFGMREMALAIFEWRMPGTLKRMPGYPSVLGLLAIAIPFDRPFNHAAMIIGLTCSAGSLAVLFLLAKRLVGRAALIPVIALLATPVFSLMSTQTMIEAFMGLLIFLTFWLSARDSQWAYVTAAWATLCRQECAVLVPLVWASNLWLRPRAWPMHTAKAFVAGLPLVGWQLFTRWAGSQTDGASAYTQEMAGMGWHLEWRKVWLMLEPYPEAKTIFQGPLLLLALIGVFVALRRWPQMALMILGFFVFYNLVHIVFSVYRIRYAYPVLFVVPLFATAGGQWLVDFIGSKTESKPKLQIAGAGLVGLLGLAWAGNRFLDFGRFEVMPWQSYGNFIGLALLALAALAAVVFLAMRGPTVARAGMALAFLGFASGPVFMAAELRAREQGYYDDANIRFRYAMQWIEANVQPGESVAVPRGESLLYWADRIDPTQVYDISLFDSEDAEAFIEELDRIGVDYLIKVRTLRLPTDPDAVNYQRNVHWYYDKRAHLSEPFRDAEPVEGFELVETIEHDEPAVIPIEPVHVYRVARDDFPDADDHPARLDYLLPPHDEPRE